MRGLRRSTYKTTRIAARECSEIVTLILIGTIGSAPSPVLAQEASPPPSAPDSLWRVVAEIGVTDFGVDEDPPGSISLLGLERRLTDRLSVGLEGGYGIVAGFGTCSFGSLQTECQLTKTWPMLGAGARFRVLRIVGLDMGLFGAADFGFHSPDWVRYYDLAIEMSTRSAMGLDVGFDVRRRSSPRGAGGVLYLFRIGVPL